MEGEDLPHIWGLAPRALRPGPARSLKGGGEGQKKMENPYRWEVQAELPGILS